MNDRKVYLDADIAEGHLEGITIAVLGYGAQGRAQARMLAESGVDVLVGVRIGGPSEERARADGLNVCSFAEAAKRARVVHFLLPDEVHGEVYHEHVKQHLQPGDLICMSHGFSVVFDQIEVEAGVGVILVAPKGPGPQAYTLYKAGSGLAGLFSVRQDTPQNDARQIALGMCRSMGFSRTGVIECSFEEETHQDLFGEQAVLCGGISALIQAGFDVLVERGYPPELAYFECLHETKLVVDLIVQGGLAYMWDVVSNTAEFGGQTRGARLITKETKAEMHKMLDEIEDGTFAREMMQEYQHKRMATLNEKRDSLKGELIETVGSRIRGYLS